MVDVARLAAGFGDRLHAAGVPVTPERSSRLAASMHLAPPATFDEFYWLARVTLLSAYEHIDIFNRVFRNLLGELADPVGAHDDVGRGSTAKPHPHTTNVGDDQRLSRAGAARSGRTDGSSPASDTTDDDSETLGMSVSHEERL
jgi:hypothetical protein